MLSFGRMAGVTRHLMAKIRQQEQRPADTLTGRRKKALFDKHDCQTAWNGDCSGCGVGHGLNIDF